MSPRCTDALSLAGRLWELVGADFCTADVRAAMRDLGHDSYGDLTDDDLRAISEYIKHDLVREDDIRDAERDRA